jgi:hypothetical protein
VEVFEKADTDSKDTSYGLEEQYFELRPEHHSESGAIESLGRFWSHKAASFEVTCGINPNALVKWEQENNSIKSIK